MHLPGPHNDPPSKDKLRSMMQKYDLNLDGLLNRDEFAEFIQRLTADTVTAVGRNPLATKRATEGIPGVGKTVKKVPNSVYASIVTLAVVLTQKSSEGYESYEHPLSMTLTSATASCKVSHYQSEIKDQSRYVDVDSAQDIDEIMACDYEYFPA